MPCTVTGEPICKCRTGTSLPTLTYPKETLRKLWSDHAIYTRLVVMDIMEHLDSAESNLQRLLQNQDEIGLYLIPMIGLDKTSELVELLKIHIRNAGACILALSQKDAVAFSNHRQRFFENADELGVFFTTVRPQLRSRSEWCDLWNEHGQHIIDLSIAQLHHDSDLVVTIFDAYYVHMLALSDTIWETFTATSCKK